MSWLPKPITSINALINSGHKLKLLIISTSCSNGKLIRWPTGALVMAQEINSRLLTLLLSLSLIRDISRSHADGGSGMSTLITQVCKPSSFGTQSPLLLLACRMFTHSPRDKARSMSLLWLDLEGTFVFTHLNNKLNLITIK
jgi:hypothetical protein